MRAVILAGGYATRLWPITKEVAKPLLPIGKKKIIDLIVDNIITTGNSIDEIIVSTNKYYQTQFEAWLEQHPYRDHIDLLIEDTLREEQKLGSIGALYNIFERYGYDTDYLVVAGDNLFSFSISDLIKFYKSKRATVLAVYDIKKHKEARRFGVLEVASDYRVKLFIEKPSNPPSTLVSTGCYIFPKEDALLVREYIMEEKRPDNPGKFIQWLYEKKPVYAYKFDGYWFDIGTPDAYLSAFKFMTKETYIAEEAVVDAKIKGPIIVLGNAEVQGGVIGPFVFIGAGSNIIDSRLGNSIILENAQLANVNLDRSIIGPRAIVKNIKLKHSIIGSFSKIDGQP